MFSPTSILYRNNAPIPSSSSSSTHPSVTPYMDSPSAYSPPLKKAARENVSPSPTMRPRGSSSSHRPAKPVAFTIDLAALTAANGVTPTRAAESPTPQRASSLNRATGVAYSSRRRGRLARGLGAATGRERQAVSCHLAQAFPSHLLPPRMADPIVQTAQEMENSSRLYEEEIAEFEQERATLRAQIATRRAEMGRLAYEAKAIHERDAALQQEYNRRYEAEMQGLAQARRAVLEITRSRERTEMEIKKVKQAMAKLNG